jgi:hypothetical protein
MDETGKKLEGGKQRPSFIRDVIEGGRSGELKKTAEKKPEKRDFRAENAAWGERPSSNEPVARSEIRDIDEDGKFSFRPNSE